MKILSSRKEKEYNNKIADLTLQLMNKEKDYRSMLDFYSNLLNDLYRDLYELNLCLKQNIKREKIRVRVQDMIIKIGGRK